MIPSPWVAIVIALGTFRLVRLASYDDFPPIEKARNWLTGARRISSATLNARAGLTDEEVDTKLRHSRPLLADLLGCPWCIGFWISLAVYLAWVFAPTETMYGLAPFALAAAAALIAKHLDP